MRKDILKTLLFILIIASCNSIDPISDISVSDNNNIDTTKNDNLFCEDCIKSFNFEITTLGVGPEGEIVD